MLRSMIASAALAAFALGAPLARAQTPPQLFAYEGAGCDGANGTPQLEAMLDHKVYGVDDFVDFRTSPANGVSALNWGLGCWQGHGYKLMLGMPLAWGQMSMADVAAGKADSYYTQMGDMLVARGFADADIRLGWEENGNWYLWRASQGPATFTAAYRHIYAVLKATKGSSFKIGFNPTAGFDFSPGYPGDDVVDELMVDAYPSAWASFGKKLEPDLWKGNLNNPWGFSSIGSYKPGKPILIPEFGVGSRPDGYGVPAGSVANGGDDPVAMSGALGVFETDHVRAVGIWDYQAPDAGTKLSAGARPQETLPFIQEFAAPSMAALFAAHTSDFTTTAAPKLTCTNCHATAYQNGPNHFMVVIYALQDQPSASLAWVGKTVGANLYNPDKGPTPIAHVGGANTVGFELTPGHPLVVAISLATP